MCDGPVEFIGGSATTLDILPPNARSLATFSKVEIPYSMKLLDQELSFFMNIGMRMLTAKNVTHLRGAPLVELTADQQRNALETLLPERTLLDTLVPERIEPKETYEATPDDLSALGATPQQEQEAPLVANVLNAAMTAAVNATLTLNSKSPSKLQSTAINAAVNAAVSAANSVNSGANAVNSGANALNSGANAINSGANALNSGANALNSGANAVNSVGNSVGNSVSLPTNTIVNSALNSLQFTSAQPAQTLAPVQTQMANFSEEEPFGADDYESLDQSARVQSMNSANNANALNSANNNSAINVQTNTQPVLVVPLNMSQGPTATQYVPSAAPGAPATLAIDTSEPAMRNIGTVPQALPRSPSRVNARVAVPAGGASSTNANSAANIKVNVVKGD
jgi:X-X-X-Leu-X-X-Gly heptad repeat protein